MSKVSNANSNAKFAIDELKSKGYSDSDIARMAGVSRQTVIQIRHGKSSGRKVDNRLWRLKSSINASGEDAPLPTASQSVADNPARGRREEEDEMSVSIAPGVIYVLLLAVFIIVLFFAVRRYNRHLTLANTGSNGRKDSNDFQAQKSV